MTVFPSAGRRWADHDSWVLRHSLSLVLVGILVAQSIAFHLTLLPDWRSEQLAHGQPATIWPDYWLHYAAEWLVSVLADTYGALLLVLLTKWFYETGSEESRQSDADDEAKR